MTVQRRAASGSNSLNEPDYGPEASYPTVYTNLALRIEYVDEEMEWVQSGERVIPKQLDMYVEPDIIIQLEDRVTISGSEGSPPVPALGKQLVAGSVEPYPFMRPAMDEVIESGKAASVYGATIKATVLT